MFGGDRWQTYRDNKTSRFWFVIFQLQKKVHYCFDGNYEFIMVDIGSNERVSDAGVFSNTLFYKNFKENKLKIPEPDYLPGISDKFPYVFIADDAFPLSNNLMKPYPHRNLSKEKGIFNYRLSRARRIIEKTLEILASRFRILLKTINL